METMPDFIARERERLNKARDEVFSQQDELQKKLDAINSEMYAIDAYESAKSGKAAPARQGAGRRGPQPGARRGSKREQLLQVIRSGNGLSRREILERMGLKGDKSGEMSVSNALTALTKSNQVARKDGRYVAG